MLRPGIDGVKRNVSKLIQGVNGVKTEVTEYWSSEGGVKKLVYQAVSYDPVLDNNDWKTISLASGKGVASSIWSVGDRKSITLSGTVGTLDVSGTYYVYILGFDHNGATNTVDFGCFKLNDGTDLCLIDGNLGNKSHDGTKNFNLNHWGITSSPYNTNYGGWKGCDARYDILGSTDKTPSNYGSMPNTSRVGFDATPTCATNPVKDTLIASFPLELRAVMKPMTIYTDNTGNKINTEDTVTLSIDYLPLLSEFEIFGTSLRANQYEQNHQAQYSYYAIGNPKIKYRHSDITRASRWSCRSPNKGGNGSFCYVDTQGSVSVTDSSFSVGISTVFRV